MATVFLNGRFISAEEATLSAFDAGLQHGVGLFETMTARFAAGEAEIPRLEEHLDRLRKSAKELGLSDALRTHALAEAVCKTVEKSKLPRSRVRLTVTGGDLNLLARKPEGATPAGEVPARIDPTVLIVAQPATEYPEAMFERGVPAAIADLRLNPLDPMSGHKTLNYWARLRELQAAAAKKAGEAIVFTVSNHVAGGCVSNVFVAKNGVLLTPIARGEEGGGVRTASGAYLPSPVLPGVTRKAVMTLARERGFECVTRMLAIDDLLEADEVFLTNSSWGVLPVVRLEREEIGGGEVGEKTRALRAALLSADLL